MALQIAVSARKRKAPLLSRPIRLKYLQRLRFQPFHFLGGNASVFGGLFNRSRFVAVKPEPTDHHSPHPLVKWTEELLNIRRKTGHALNFDLPTAGVLGGLGLSGHTSPFVFCVVGLILSLWGHGGADPERMPIWSFVTGVPWRQRLDWVGHAFLLAVTLLVAGCSAGVSVHVTENADQYNAAWRNGMTAIAHASDAFKSGVCNIGGDQNGCHAASVAAIAAIDGFLNNLSHAKVPSDFAGPNADVRKALQDWRDGLARRNRGFEQQSDADFRAGNDEIKAATQAFVAAYQRFPTAARPQPAP